MAGLTERRIVHHIRKRMKRLEEDFGIDPNVGKSQCAKVGRLAYGRYAGMREILADIQEDAVEFLDDNPTVCEENPTDS